jgi:NACHT N-terminal Helical domain 7
VRREPTLTFSGALQVLGVREREIIEKLDSILGGVILTSGVGAGVAAISVPALAPLAFFAPLWGWVDQKNEATSLLRRIIDRSPDRIVAESGLERRRLVAAAHTIIVPAALFEVFAESLSGDVSARLQITDQERLVLAEGFERQRGVTFWDRLYSFEVPAPSVTCGFHENLTNIERWMTELAIRLRHFLEGLSVWSMSRSQFPANLPQKAMERYKSFYVRLANAAPEFAIWSMLEEHAATRLKVSDATGAPGSLLASSDKSLSRVELLLSTRVVDAG